MRKQKIFYSIYLLFLVNSLSAQVNELILNNSEIQIGIDYKNRNYLVLNGFDFYYKKGFDKLIWEKISYKSNELPFTKDFPYNFL
jgi:hypothetical protein